MSTSARSRKQRRTFEVYIVLMRNVQQAVTLVALDSLYVRALCVLEVHLNPAFVSSEHEQARITTLTLYLAQVVSCHGALLQVWMGKTS